MSPGPQSGGQERGSMERKMVELEDTGLTFATEVDLERLQALAAERQGKQVTLDVTEPD